MKRELQRRGTGRARERSRLLPVPAGPHKGLEDSRTWATAPRVPTGACSRRHGLFRAWYCRRDARLALGGAGRGRRLGRAKDSGSWPSVGGSRWSPHGVPCYWCAGVRRSRQLFDSHVRLKHKHLPSRCRVTPRAWRGGSEIPDARGPRGARTPPYRLALRCTIAVALADAIPTGGHARVSRPCLLTSRRCAARRQ
jgi:hypothetical protein